MLKHACCILLIFGAVIAVGQEQKFAELGDFKLESGEVIRDCRVGYRTFGQLNASKSNAILFPTWAGGTTEQLAGNIGPGRLADTNKYYVVAVDALSNGVSSSPSNSSAQPRMKFPRFSMRDLVNTQHELLTKHLHLTHLRAVMGISMGGMQTFQWIVSYPDFMDKAIPIVGSPQMAAYDLLHWQAEIDANMNAPGWNNGEYTENPAKISNAEFGMLLLTTPENFNRTHTRERLMQELAKAKEDAGQDPNNKIRQCQAMMSMDVGDKFGGSLQQAASSVRTKALIIVASQDHVVTPETAREFAKYVRAPVVELTGDCGHQAPGCEEPKLKAALVPFLDN